MEIWHVIMATITAGSAFAGVVFIALQWRDRIAADIKVFYQPPPGAEQWTPGTISDKVDRLHVRARVVNNTARSIDVTGIEVAGIPFIDGSEKHSERIVMHVPVMSSVDLSTVADPDWPAMAQSLSSGGRMPKLRASVIMDCNTRMYAMRSRTATKTVSADIITKNAAKANQTS